MEQESSRSTFQNGGTSIRECHAHSSPSVAHTLDGCAAFARLRTLDLLSPVNQTFPGRDGGEQETGRRSDGAFDRRRSLDRAQLCRSTALQTRIWLWRYDGR